MIKKSSIMVIFLTGLKLVILVQFVNFNISSYISSVKFV